MNTSQERAPKRARKSRPLPLDAAGKELVRLRYRYGAAAAGPRRARIALERQGLGLLDLRQLLHLVEHVGRDRAVDFDQRDGVAALLDPAEMEGRDVQPGIAEQAREGADEAGLVLIRDVDHRLAEFGIDANALDVDQPRLAVVIDG